MMESMWDICLIDKNRKNSNQIAKENYTISRLFLNFFSALMIFSIIILFGEKKSAIIKETDRDCEQCGGWCHERIITYLFNYFGGTIWVDSEVSSDRRKRTCSVLHILSISHASFHCLLVATLLGCNLQHPYNNSHCNACCE